MTRRIDRLWLTDFRNYTSTEVEFAPGITAIVGRNGHGKTNLLEAIGHLSGVAIRGASSSTMVRVGADRAVVRAEAQRASRALLLEAEIAAQGRNRLQINKQPVRRRRDLAEALAVTVFSPDDLELVKGGPGGRRGWLDDAVVDLDPRADEVRGDVDRILKQRNALLKSIRMKGGRKAFDEGAQLTLDVWDDRLHRAGHALRAHRERALDTLAPMITTAYRDLAGRELPITAAYTAAWPADGLSDALVAARDDDLRRGITTVGPHRDEIDLRIDGLPSRTHASQGEQRSLALALRLAVHRAVTDAHGTSPILLLDDVLSELDDGRGTGLLDHLPPGQTLLTTAGHLPPDTTPELILDVADGTVRPR